MWHLLPNMWSACGSILYRKCGSKIFYKIWGHIRPKIKGIFTYVISKIFVIMGRPRTPSWKKKGGSVKPKLRWLKIIKWKNVILEKFQNKKDCHVKRDYRCFGQQFSSHRSKTDWQIRYKEDQPPTITDCNANDRASRKKNKMNLNRY